VTKRIQSLERRVGARVFDRGRLGVTPTPFGASLYPPVKRALAQLDEVARVAADGRERADSGLRLSASHTIGEFLLPGWLLQFRPLATHVHPQLQVINSGGAASRSSRVWRSPRSSAPARWSDSRSATSISLASFERLAGPGTALAGPRGRSGAGWPSGPTLETVRGGTGLVSRMVRAETAIPGRNGAVERLEWFWGAAEADNSHHGLRALSHDISLDRRHR
jgi:hypothetical protein